MFTKSGVEMFLLTLGTAFTELSRSMKSEKTSTFFNPTIEGLTPKNDEKEAPKKERKPRTTKAEKAKLEIVEEDESEDVESPYTESDDDLAGMDDEETEEEPVEEKEPTTEDLRAAVMAYALKHGKAKAYKVLGKYVKKPAGENPKANEVTQKDIAKAMKELKA